MSTSDPIPMTEPTASSDPQGYLSLKKFNCRLRRCPRTNHPVTFSDIGDKDGVPCLYVLPSGCSRWIAAPLDPLAKIYGVRLIVVDRPGCGGTGEVPLAERIERSCEMIVSVLEHLDVKPAHMLVASAGIYYTLHLLTRHPSAFLTSLHPPPRVYLISPWSPLLEPDHPEYWSFKWSWIPTPLIATQHITTPQLIKAAQVAQTAWESGTKVFESGRSLARSWFKSIMEEPASTSTSTPVNNASSSTSINGSATEKQLQTIPGTATERLDESTAGLGEGTEVPVPREEEKLGGESEAQAGEGSQPRNGRMWGPCPCCIGCLTTEYMQAENGQGVGQEHLICLNRGPQNTGADWLRIATDDLASAIDFSQTPEHDETSTPNADADADAGQKVDRPIQIHVWWGWQDSMVPRKGQLWFNKVLSSHPNEINFSIHDVPDGDHTDLLARREGIHQVFTMIQTQGHSTTSLT